MTALLLIMPNGRVRLASAALGGIAGGVMWQIALVLHVDLQMGVARYNALYSGFGAFPIFLVWMYVSWLVVLLAGELGASHQNEQAVRQRLRAKEVDEALEESIGLVLMARAVRGFLGWAPRPSATALASELGVPAQKLDEIADALIAGGVLVAPDVDGERTFLPGRDVDTVRVGDLLAILRHRTHPLDRPPPIELEVPAAISETVHDLERAETTADANVTVRELAARLDGAGAGAGAGR
jgi:membrane protein